MLTQAVDRALLCCWNGASTWAETWCCCCSVLACGVAMAQHAIARAAVIESPETMSSAQPIFVLWSRSLMATRAAIGEGPILSSQQPRSNL